MLSRLSDGQAEVPVCEDPPPPYSEHDFQDVQEQAQALRRPARSPDVPVPASSPATADKRHTSGRSVVGQAVILLHTANYVLRSLGTSAWGTRAIEYAIGTGFFASSVLLAKTFRLTDTIVAYKRSRVAGLGPPDAEAERKLLAALVVVFSAGIPRMGHCIRSLLSGRSVESVNDYEFLTQAVSGVPTFIAMVVIWWIGSRAGGILARG